MTTASAAAEMPCTTSLRETLALGKVMMEQKSSPFGSVQQGEEDTARDTALFSGIRHTADDTRV